MTLLPQVVERVLVPSQLFGPLQVSADEVITFPRGLLGFEAQQRYVLLPAADAGVYWMQSCDEGALVFLVVDPAPHVAGYVESVRSWLVGEGVPASDALGVLCVVTLPETRGAPCSCNLLGPLVIDFAARTAAQHVLGEGTFDARHPIHLLAPSGGSSSGRRAPITAADG